ncbi:MAG: hypothetical protein WBC07_09685 [Methylotenera sp.]
MNQKKATNAVLAKWLLNTNMWLANVYIAMEKNAKNATSLAKIFASLSSCLTKDFLSGTAEKVLSFLLGALIALGWYLWF